MDTNYSMLQQIMDFNVIDIIAKNASKMDSIKDVFNVSFKKISFLIYYTFIFIDKELISCEECGIGFHETCVPAGCSISNEKTIICPKHIKGKNFIQKIKNNIFLFSDYESKNECSENETVPKEQTSSKFIRNNAIKIIQTNKFADKSYRNGFKIKKGNVEIQMCGCEKNKENRCGDESCLNWSLRQECPKECGKMEGGCRNRLISNKINLYKNLEISFAENMGYGLRTNIDISKVCILEFFNLTLKFCYFKGSYIGEYCGEIISKEEKEERDSNNEKWNSKDVGFYSMAFNGYFIDGTIQGSIMRYSNHSCNPNLITQTYTASNYIQHVCFFAKKNIKAGEELTFSYASNHHQNKHSFKCFCGTESCKGFFKA